MSKTLRTIADLASGVVAGLTVGFVTALLLAPEEGDETRSKLTAGAEGALKKPRELADDIQVRVNRAIEEGRQAAAEARADMEASAGLHDR
jgi:gas vesicle protein